MQQAPHLKTVEQAAWRALQQDGLTEILLGIFLVVTAGWIHDSGLLIFWMLVFFFSSPILEGIRRRFTYPRVGYARLVEEKSPKILLGMALYTIPVIAALALALLLFGDRADGTFWGLCRQWSPTLAGLLLAGGFMYQATVSGWKRYRVFAALAIGLGIAFSFRSPQTYTGVKLYLLTTGGLLFLYGVATFVVFLRSNTIPQEEVLDGTE